MIATIVLTATATAAIVLSLTHRRTSYIASVEQTALERGEDLRETQAMNDLLTNELTAQQEITTGLIRNNQIYRDRIKVLEIALNRAFADARHALAP